MVFCSCFLQDMVAETAMKWTKVLRTGAVEVKFMGVDLSTIMFTMERGQDTVEVCFCSPSPKRLRSINCWDFLTMSTEELGHQYLDVLHIWRTFFFANKQTKPSAIFLFTVKEMRSTIISPIGAKWSLSLTRINLLVTIINSCIYVLG
jgi:hypothetical protein